MSFLKPQDVVKNLPLESGMTVADFGSCTGAFVFALSEKVGKSGKVYAIDINNELLITTKRNAEKHGYENVQIIWTDIEKEGSTKLKDGSLDAVVLSNTLFQITNKDTLSKEIARVLKKKGKLFVIDWKDSFCGIGPHSNDVVKEEDVEKLFSNFGFGHYNSTNVGDYHYCAQLIKE